MEFVGMMLILVVIIGGLILVIEYWAKQENKEKLNHMELLMDKGFADCPAKTREYILLNNPELVIIPTEVQ